ncbi:hypothetical protein UFOVP1437_49 [uncultured Caudovirales phage]|uniref:Uncharacterized protein n=1 Tax=uncultured Caudovirales phage TaxID=2100421 RepID=A0A6J5SFF8_9CAUD|nr:hypothetical protein UFOVP1437_49 [uncultured Caudovirales phage]CAB5228122.1 hypothetical protein UFOVP1531_16 [uncultured Caudovirales phage]
MNTLITKDRLERSRMLGEFDCALKAYTDKELLESFDRLVILLMNVTIEITRDMIANALDLVAHEIYIRKRNRMH